MAHKDTTNQQKPGKGKRQRPQFLLHTPKELKPYRKYPALFREMRFAHNFPAQPFPLLNLPIEIRLQILRYLLKFDKPIELWHKTGKHTADYHARATGRKVLKYQLRAKGRNVLNVLRTCKKLNEEAASVFYGENEWRVSGLNGAMVAHAFFYTIGTRHVKHITSLILPVPFWSRDETHYGDNWCATSLNNKYSLKARCGFATPFFSKWEYVKSFKAVCVALTRAGNLRSLNLIMPVELDIRGTAEPFLEHLRRLAEQLPALKITVVRMYRRGSDDEVEFEPSHCWLYRDPLEWGWEIKQAAYHRKGWYVIEDNTAWFPAGFMDALCSGDWTGWYGP